MPEDQQGSKWNKIFRQIKGGSDEEGEDGNTEDENDHEVDESIKAELATRSNKDYASSSLSTSGSRISESVNISLQWLDKMCGKEGPEHLHGLHAGHPPDSDLCLDHPKCHLEC